MKNRATNNYVINKEDFCLTDSDFYPPEDTRVLRSLVKDVYGGDTFAEFSEYIFDLYESEDCYEN